MSRHVDDVVRSPEDEIVAILVAYSPIESRIHHRGLESTEIGADEALVVAPYGGQTSRRQRRRDGNDALLVRARLGRIGLSQQFQVVAVRRETRAAEFQRRALHARNRGQDRPAGFGLPVVVDDRLAERVGNPTVGRLVQRFAGQEQVFERRDVVLLEIGRILFFQHPNSGWRGEHHLDLALLHDLPPNARVRSDR